eukprot:sb/3477373/
MHSEKFEPGSRTVIPNCVTESPGHLAPSSAASPPTLHHQEQPPETPAIDEEVAASAALVSAVLERAQAHCSVEQNLNFGSDDDVHFKGDGKQLTATSIRDIRVSETET